jgi:glycosyltransferase involved in cell wall biosynthesis
MQSGARTRLLFCEGNIDGTVGGSYYCLLNLIRCLDKSRYEITVVFHFEHDLIPEFREAGARIVVRRRPDAFTWANVTLDRGRVLRFLGPVAIPLQSAMNFVRQFALPALDAVRIIRRSGAQIVHLNNSISYSHEWMIAARICGARCVVTERAMAARFSASTMIFRFLVDSIICVSETVRRNMSERGIESRRMVTVYDGIDLRSVRPVADRAAIRAKYGIGPAAPLVVMVGNLKEWKGQRTLIGALDHVKRVVPTVRCLLVGGAGPADMAYASSLRRMIQDLALASHVIFTGTQRHTVDFYLASDVVVVPSIVRESFGMVVVEAMACAKPVVASRIGAIPEIIDEGADGLMFVPGDAHDLAGRILDLLADPDRAQRLGQCARDSVTRRFCMAQTSQSVERVYDQLLPGLRA